MEKQQGNIVWLKRDLRLQDHPLRIYNPTIQAKQHDAKGEFIHEWIPELRNVPAPMVFEPWKMTSLDQQLYHCAVGEDYPFPIIAFGQESREVKEKYWEFRNRKETLNALYGVWERLCIPENREIYEKQLGL